MSITQQLIQLSPTAIQMHQFEEVYTFRAAQEQAEKAKLNAFGMLAKLTPWNRPKEDTVLLARSESRIEPFWHIEATRTVDYTCNVHYPVSVHNPHAQKVMLLGQQFELMRTGDKAKFELPTQEHCHRKLPYAQYLDGLKRTIKPGTLQDYCDKYKSHKLAELDAQHVVKPLLSQQAAIQMACAALNSHAINAHDIQQDIITLDDISLYLRPVFAFEFIWSSAEKTGVIEVDGLTGMVQTDGQWFADKLGRIFTRQMMVDAGAELAGSLIPGGGFAIKVLDQFTAPAANQLPHP